MLAETLILSLFLLLVFAAGLAKQGETGGEKLPEHPIRMAILRTLQRHPGANIAEVCEHLGRHRGTLTHHLYLLERSDRVSSLPQGRERRFFLKDEFQGLRRKIALIRQEGVDRLVRAVLDEPGIIQKELTRRTAITRKAVRHYVDLLAGEGLLSEVPRARTRRYYPTQALYHVMAQVNDETPPDGNPTQDRAPPAGPEPPR